MSLRKTYCIQCGKPLSDYAFYKETVKCKSCSHRGKPTWNKGKTGLQKHSQETKEKIRLGNFGKEVSLESRNRISRGHKGIKLSIEHRKSLSESHKNKGLGEENNNWRGGTSTELYTSMFNRQLKDRIRVRDNFVCKVCNIPELEFMERLCIHHIDYNKKNNEHTNLISLCRVCHSKTCGNREYWKNFFADAQMAGAAK